MVIDRDLRCSVRDCGVTRAGVKGKALGADRIDLESKLSADLDNFPMVVLGSSRVGLIGELGVFPARSEEGIMVWQIDTGLIYNLTKSTCSWGLLGNPSKLLSQVFDE